MDINGHLSDFSCHSAIRSEFHLDQHVIPSKAILKIAYIRPKTKLDYEISCIKPVKQPYGM